MYHMQKEAQEELSPVMQLKLSKDVVHLVRGLSHDLSHDLSCDLMLCFAAPEAV